MHVKVAVKDIEMLKALGPEDSLKYAEGETELKTCCRNIEQEFVDKDKQSITARGLLDTEFIVVATKKGIYYLLDGYHRKTALKELFSEVQKMKKKASPSQSHFEKFLSAMVS